MKKVIERLQIENDSLKRTKHQDKTIEKENHRLKVHVLHRTYIMYNYNITTFELNAYSCIRCLVHNTMSSCFKPIFYMFYDIGRVNEDQGISC